MERKVIMNKLMLNGALLGYRFDIVVNGGKVVSLDLMKTRVRVFFPY